MGLGCLGTGWWDDSSAHLLAFRKEGLWICSCLYCSWPAPCLLNPACLTSASSRRLQLPGFFQLPSEHSATGINPRVLGAGQSLIPSVTFGRVSRGMSYVCLLRFKSALLFARLFVFLEFKVPRGAGQKGWCFPRIAAYVLPHANSSPSNFSLHKQVGEKGREPDSVPGCICCHSSIAAFTPYPKFLQPLPSLRAAHRLPSHAHLLQVCSVFVQLLASSSTPCASPLGWWTSKIAAWVKQSLKGNCLLSYSLLPVVAWESCFVSSGRQQGSRAYYILVFTFSSQLKYPQGAHFLCLKQPFWIIMSSKIPFRLCFKCWKVSQARKQVENSCFLQGRETVNPTIIIQRCTQKA